MEKYLTAQVSECKNKILLTYTDLIVCYENSRQLFDSILEPKVSGTLRSCSQLVAYNYDSVIAIWEIVSLDGTLLYSSDKYRQNNQWILDLSTLNMQPGTQFKFRANLETITTEYSTDTFVYEPETYTLYYCYRSEGGGDTALDFLAIVESPLSPPVLKCSAISVHNDAMVMTKYELRLISTGKTFYTSGRYNLNDNWNKKFSDLSITAGTQFKLHSGIIAGSDSEGYVVMEYDPTSTTTAIFTLGGVTANTITMYGKPDYVH